MREDILGPGADRWLCNVGARPVLGYRLFLRLAAIDAAFEHVALQLYLVPSAAIGAGSPGQFERVIAELSAADNRLLALTHAIGVIFIACPAFIGGTIGLNRYSQVNPIIDFPNQKRRALTTHSSGSRPISPQSASVRVAIEIRRACPGSIRVSPPINSINASPPSTALPAEVIM